jgi:hypothetical protein
MARNQKGPQQHAEGQHGEKTRRAFLKGQLIAQDAEEAERPSIDNDTDVFGRVRPGRHRLDEDRQQHDEAEKNSENGKVRG